MEPKNEYGVYPTLGEIWDYAIELGIRMGHRDARAVWQVCKRNKARYARMSPERKRLFDKTGLTVPFGDCRIYAGRLSGRIRGLLAVIDATPEVALHIHELNTKGGWNIDLLFAHHAGFKEVMYKGEDFCVPDARCLAQLYGVSIESMNPIESEARKMARIPGCGCGGPGSGDAVARQCMTVSGTAEMCRQMDVAHINIHTPCDVFLWRAVWDVLNAAGLTTCQDAIDVLYRIPEFRRFRQQHHQPIRMLTGKPRSRLGRWWNANCAATLTLNEKSVRAIRDAGFDTMVGVIYEGKITEEANKHGLNVIHLPHYASDTLGINGLLDCLIERWPSLDVLAHGAFFRVERPHCGAWATAAI